MFFLGVSSSRNEEKKCLKNEKKKNVAETGNGPLPNCVTIQCELYREMVVWKDGLAWGGEAVS